MPHDRRRTGRALLLVAVVIVVALLLLLPPTQDLLRKYLVDPFSPQYPEEVELGFKRTMTLDANGGHITNYIFDLPRPVGLQGGDGHLQEISSLDLSTHYDELWDNGTYETMVWSGEDLYSTRSISLTFYVRQTLHRWDLDETTVLGREQVPQELQDRYLGDEWKITPGEPGIQALSAQIVAGETNVFLVARSIYDWMLENIEYPNLIVSGEPRSALETYEDGEGDCDDQSILFCALARASGVPAWLQLGAIYDRNTNEMGGHGWVQMHMPTAKGGVNVTIDLVNEKFLIWMPNLFCEFTDNGDPDALRDYYHPIIITYDSSSYPLGTYPEFEEGWEVLSYEEGEMVPLSLELMARADD